MADATTTDEKSKQTETGDDPAAALKSALDKERAARKDAEKAAKSNADAAKRLAELEEQQKSADEKMADRLAALESETKAAKAQALRFKIAAKHNISDEDADLFLTGDDEETLTAQAERLAARDDAGKKRGNHVPGEGRTPKNKKTDDLQEFTRGIFGHDS